MKTAVWATSWGTTRSTAWEDPIGHTEVGSTATVQQEAQALHLPAVL